MYSDWSILADVQVMSDWMSTIDLTKDQLSQITTIQVEQTRCLFITVILQLPTQNSR